MKVHLTTLGCPKNQVDSELMLRVLGEAGFPLAERANDQPTADLLTQRLGEASAENSRHRVGGATGRERDHQGYRPHRPLLGRRGPRPRE